MAWLPKRKGVEKRNLSGDSRKCRLHDVLSRELEIEVTPKNVEIAYLKYCLFSISKRIHVHGLKKTTDCKELYKTRSKGSVLQYPTSTPEHHCPKNHRLAVLPEELCAKASEHPHIFFPYKLCNFSFCLTVLSSFTYQ